MEGKSEWEATADKNAFHLKTLTKPRDYFAEWRKSEREKQIPHMNIDIYIDSRKIVLINLFAGHQWRERTDL